MKPKSEGTTWHARVEYDLAPDRIGFVSYSFSIVSALGKSHTADDIDAILIAE
jgi:hypothetical protein